MCNHFHCLYILYVHWGHQGSYLDASNKERDRKRARAHSRLQKLARFGIRS